MLPRIFLITLCPLLFSSCDLAEQWQESRKLDEEYTQYLESNQGESPELTKIKKAAAECARAQIRIIHSDASRKDTIIPLNDDELTTLRSIIPHLQDTPALSRESWDRMQNDLRNGNMLTGIQTHFTDLEYLNNKGETIGNLSLSKGLGKTEQAATYRNKYYKTVPTYMLPEAAHQRLYALSAVKQAEED